jgi:Flp pilus assembly protein TadG
MRISNRNGFRERLLGFGRESKGSVATIFAVSLVPVLIAAGVGVDMSRAMSSRSNLQDALDATALALAHLPSSTSQATLDAKATTWMAANLHDGNMTTPLVTTALTNGQVVLNATSTVRTTLTAIAGYQQIPISAHSTVKWGLGKVEVALVLDNTGSMAGTKLSRLKDAAEDLVETLEAQVVGQPVGTLKIGLVPFSTTVRLSSSTTTLNTYKSATWMTGTMPTQYGEDLFSNSGGVTQYSNRWTYFTNVSETWDGCVEARPAPYDVQDTAPSTGTPATLFVPYFAPDEPDSDALPKPGWNNGYYDSYNSYLPDEKDKNDASANGANTDLKKWRYMQGYTGKYDQSADTSYGKGPNYGCNMQALVRLTTNMTTVKDKIDDMNATGNTNIPIGLMWGWHVLSPNLPFADGVAYSTTDTKKFLVLLTDGDNVYSSADNPSDSLYTTLGYAWQNRMPGITVGASDADRETAMNTRMGTVCTNIKNAGITIFAVRIDVSGTAPASLSSCASSADKFFDIDSSDLDEAFANIAGSIGKLRIAQ